MALLLYSECNNPDVMKVEILGMVISVAFFEWIKELEGYLIRKWQRGFEIFFTGKTVSRQQFTALKWGNPYQ
jgi:hypothetical protein